MNPLRNLEGTFIVNDITNFLHTVHYIRLNKPTMLQRLDLTPPSGEKQERQEPTVMGPLETIPICTTKNLRLAQCNGPIRVNYCLPIQPEDGCGNSL